MSNTATAARRYFYLWIGSAEIGLAKPAARFVIETTGIPKLNEDFPGRVVARNKNTLWKMGHEGKSWANPITDATNGFSSEFVKVSSHRIGEYCKEISLD